MGYDNFKQEYENMIKVKFYLFNAFELAQIPYANFRKK